ncbi:MAG: hypothetical protein K9K67_05290 [Bacteriovoracaceae bacterium]|nr:hypothetical protein [Bacteriovoracaceae bacterium]
MKTFNYFKLRSIGRKLSLLGLVAMLATSCGSDKNETGPGNSGTGTLPVGTSPVFNGGNDLSVWNSLKSSYSCSQGRMQDMTFTLQQGGSGNYISGNLQSGSVGGSSQGSYYGRSGNGDLVFISKVTNGNQLAFNVVLSFCQWTDPQYGVPYIGPNAQMSNFMVQNLVLNNSGSCATGAVTSGYIGFYSPAYGGYIPIQVASAGLNCY